MNPKLTLAQASAIFICVMAAIFGFLYYVGTMQARLYYSHPHPARSRS